MQTVTLNDFELHCIGLLKQVETVGESLLITDGGRSVARIIPCDENYTVKRTEELLSKLRGNVQYYDAPEEPVAETEWESLRC